MRGRGWREAGKRRKRREWEARYERRKGREGERLDWGRRGGGVAV